MPMHSDYPTLENMRQNLTHSILQRGCHLAWKIVSWFGLSEWVKWARRTNTRMMYQRACFSDGKLSVGPDDPTRMLLSVGLMLRCNDQWTLQIEFKFGTAPDDPMHWSSMSRINTSDKWRQQELHRVTATMEKLVGSDDPTPCHRHRRIIRRYVEKSSNGYSTAIWVGGLYKRLSLVLSP